MVLTCWVSLPLECRGRVEVTVAEDEDCWVGPDEEATAHAGEGGAEHLSG